MENQKELQPHQQRVVDEKNELQKKHDALSDFILENPIFLKLPEDEQRDLEKQFSIMGQYLDVLNRRISRF